MGAFWNTYVEWRGVGLGISYGGTTFVVDENRRELFHHVSPIRPQPGIGRLELAIAWDALQVPGGRSWTFGLAVPILIFAVLAIEAHRQFRPPKPGRCRQCGYDLAGNASGRCPECGRDMPRPAL